MLVLVIDTSSAAVAAAVVEASADGVRVLAEQITVNARGHGELLAPSIVAALAGASSSVDGVDAVVAGVGPGPYTGLRVGLVTAAVFAEARGIPVYGVCSLDAIGDATRDEPALLVAADARRKEVYWARYEHGIRVDGPAVNRPADVPVAGCSAVSGAGAELYDFGLPKREPVFPPALGLARCALDRLLTGAPSDPLAPLYLRRPDAVVPPPSKAVSP